MGCFSSAIFSVAESIGYVVTEVVKGFHWVIKKGFQFVSNLISYKKASEHFTTCNYDHLIESVEIRSVEIQVPFRYFFNIVTQVLTGQQINHHYVILKVRNQNHQSGYYCAQFSYSKNIFSSFIQVKYFSTFEEADRCGRAAAGSSHLASWCIKAKNLNTISRQDCLYNLSLIGMVLGNQKRVHQALSKIMNSPQKYFNVVTMSKVVSFSKEFNHVYDVAYNNCQMFASQLYDCL